MKKLIFILLAVFSVISSTNASVWNLGTLATPNTTESIDVYENYNHTFQYTITGVSTNVVVRAEGSADGTNWFNFADDGLNITNNVNSTYKTYKSAFAAKLVRFNWISKSPVVGGGTTPNITIKYIGNK